MSIAVYYSGGGLEDELKSTNIPIFHLNKQSRWDIVRFLRGLLRLIANQKPDILHAYLTDSNTLSILIKPFLPKMKTVWGVRASYIDFAQYDWLTKIIFTLTCRLSKRADLIIANSYAGRLFHQERGYPSEKIIVIPNGIDTCCFRPDPDAGSRIRKEWNVGENEILIGHVGRLDPIKDHPTFLEAAALLLKHRNDVRFVCVGEGKTGYREMLQRMTEELRIDDRIIWAGLRKDMHAVYNAFNCLTLTSRGEGFPNVIGEAMACGIPCVATDVGDAARIVGDTGIVVPLGDLGAVVQGWFRILGMTREETVIAGEKARDRIVTQFGAGVFIDRTEESLRALL